MPIKFSQFIQGGRVDTSDIIVGLDPNGQNAQFTPSTVLPYTSIATASYPLSVNNGYTIDYDAGTVTLTLPSLSAYGSVIELLSTVNHTFSVSVTGSQAINFGNKFTSTNGFVSTGSGYTFIRMICTQQNTSWAITNCEPGYLIIN
jgi:hypothetical protein